MIIQSVALDLAGLGSRSRLEPGVFDSLEPEPEPEPEPLGKKSQEPEPELVKISRLLSPARR